MSLVPAVTELLLAELLYLQYDNPTRPIFMYINSAGVQARHLCFLLVSLLPAVLGCIMDVHISASASAERRRQVGLRVRGVCHL